MTEQKVQGIEETKDVIKFLTGYVAELKDHKIDDGKIDAGEALAALAEKSKDAVEAVMGSWNLPKEMNDLDAAEKEELLSLCMVLVVSMTELVLGIEIGEGE